MSQDKVTQQASQICQEYLQGVWKKVPPHHLVIRQISGGLSNLVFYVGLPSGFSPTGQEPSCVLLRLFGDLSVGPQHHYRVITETVVFTMLAERGLGPSLRAVFPGGRLEEFISGHSMSWSEMRSPEYSSEIARNVALIHSLDIPVSKEPSWLHDTMRAYHSKLKPIKLSRVPEEERPAAESVSLFDIHHEMDWLLALINKLQCPVVFSHNDINTGNILVKDNYQGCDPVVLIDFEFSSYNYRSFDIANHFNEWMYDYRRKDYPYYYRNTDKYPSKSEQERWVRTYVQTYLEQQSLIRENNAVDLGNTHKVDQLEEEQQVLKEISVFCLASHLLWTLWSLKQAQHSNIPFAYYSYAKDKIEDYREKKLEVLSLYNIGTSSSL